MSWPRDNRQLSWTDWSISSDADATLTQNTLRSPGKSTVPLATCNEIHQNDETGREASIPITITEPHPAEKQRRLRSNFIAWVPEILWSFSAIVVFIALVVLLQFFDHQPRPYLPVGLTLNTLVALLATACRLMTAVPIEEGISQLKWNWMAAHQRPLHHLHKFDQASRGPIGSMRLIPIMRGKFIPLVSTGLIVLLSSLLTSFATQSAISYQDFRRQTKSENLVPRAPVALHYDVKDSERNQNRLDHLRRTSEMARAGYQGLLQSVQTEWPQIQLQCPSQFCEWPSFSSLAVCRTISNVTDHLQLKSGPESTRPGSRTQYQVSLPGKDSALNVFDLDSFGLNMTSPEDKPYEKAETESWTSFALADDDAVLRTAFSRFYIHYTNFASPTVPTSFRATEVFWHFCVDTYDVDVTNATSETRSSATATRVHEVYGNPQTSHYSSFSMESEDGGQVFNVSDRLRYLLKLNMKYSLQGTSNSVYGDESVLPAVVSANMYYGYQASSEERKSAGENPSEEELDKELWSNTEKLTQSVADAMTTHLRATEKSGTVRGSTFEMQTYIVVRWEWLSFLAAQIFLTIIFQIAVIIQTARMSVEIVKSSSMAELFALHGNDDDNSSRNWILAAAGLRARGIGTNINNCVEAKLIPGSYGWNLQIK
ncbi:unnamed protein product [Clonostachys rosea]|uniref:Uncharacterized protein n=1 Tax=Bionectria ochroleuca TaxID=29856 RepID=A0ABY6UPY0_BIOOC|nr:unnamed protein product [Clonostachys rosea]